MNRVSRLVAIVLTAALFSIHWSAEAEAQNRYTFVSHSGSDSNNCYEPTNPCLSLAGGLAKTVNGGVITCVDAGYFGFITITISVTIDCAAGGGGANLQFITINAPGQIVKLRNLGVNGFGVSLILIDIEAASDVFLENVFAANSAGYPGIYDQRTGPGVLTINNSSVVGVSGPGILIAPASGTIGVDLDNVRSANNLYGIAVGSGGRVMIKNSVFAGNTTAGIEGDPGSYIDINTSQTSFNSTGIVSSGSTTISASGVLSNSTAISGPTQSYGNNRIVANSAAGTAPTMIPSQ
jgi:hypothetical protein